MKYEMKFRLGLRECNPMGYLSNKQILGLFEEAGTAHSDSVGNGIKQIHAGLIDKSWVILHWKVKILKRPQYAETVTVETWATTYTGNFCFRNYRVYNEKGELAIICTSQWTMIDLENMKLAKLSEEINQKYQPEPDDHVFMEDNDKIEKLREPENYSEVYTYTVPRFDIDLNEHVNNLCYMDIAYEALPEDIYQRRNNFDEFEVMYRKQCKLGDRLKCHYSETDEGYYVTIKSEDEKTLHSIIKLRDNH